MRPLVVIPMGDAAGIGPEITVKPWPLSTRNNMPEWSLSEIYIFLNRR